MRPYALAVLAALLTGCASVASEPEPSAAQVLANTDTHLRSIAIPQQEAFQQRVQAGMSREEVSSVVTQIAIETRERGYEPYHADGQPGSREFSVVNGANVEVWQYPYYDKVFVLSFQNDALTSLTTQPGRSLLGGGR